MTTQHITIAERRATRPYAIVAFLVLCIILIAETALLVIELAGLATWPGYWYLIVLVLGLAALALLVNLSRRAGRRSAKSRPRHDAVNGGEF